MVNVKYKFIKTSVSNKNKSYPEFFYLLFCLNISLKSCIPRVRENTISLIAAYKIHAPLTSTAKSHQLLSPCGV